MTYLRILYVFNRIFIFFALHTHTYTQTHTHNQTKPNQNKTKQKYFNMIGNGETDVVVVPVEKKSLSEAKLADVTTVDVNVDGGGNDYNANKNFTLEDVAQHNSEESCWVVHDNVVYDVTDFLRKHPGGSGIILDYAGTEISFNDFPSNHYHKHSGYAIKKLKAMKIGTIAQDRSPKKGRRSIHAPVDQSTEGSNYFWKLAFSWPGVILFPTIFVLIIMASTTFYGLRDPLSPAVTRAIEFDCYHKMNFTRSVGNTSDCAAFNYPYRLVEQDVYFHGQQVIVWLLYLLHQTGVWFLIRLAKRAKRNGEIAWSPGLPNKYAKMMMVLNLSMVSIKFIHSFILYDGLASMVPEMSALYSVALWIAVYIPLEMPRRGLAFGYLRSFSCKGYGKELSSNFFAMVREGHGYVFGFGLVYNFWYHPIEGAPSFLLGYYYQLMMISQSNLLYNAKHRNKYWTFALEAAVVPHSVITSLLSNHNNHLMFGFGFTCMLMITQLHGLGIRKMWRAAILIVFLASAVWAKALVVMLRIGSSGLLFGSLSYILYLIGYYAIALPTQFTVRCMVSNEVKAKYILSMLHSTAWFVLWAFQIAAFIYLGPSPM